ncbi:MAG: signal peptidase I [Bernardetiaceae bacterium]|jgi:signal peptidase I|nr:signal peptidase I [Bernardetiaceae bacterium]
MSIFGKKNPAEKAPPVKKSVLREWIDAIVFAVVVATLFRWFFVEPFTIPSPSMENSLLTGDYLFVSKLHYGARTPKTPLQIPLAANKIWGTEIPSFLDFIQLPQFRLPGFSEVKRGDAVVFNYPPEVKNPVDMRTYYIKRCVGLPGEEIAMINQQVLINGQPIPLPEKALTSYLVESKEELSPRILQGFGIPSYCYTLRATGEAIINTDSATIAEIKKAPYINAVTKQVYLKNSDPQGRFFGDVDGFTNVMLPNYDWTFDNFGPLRIPKKGETWPVDAPGLQFYEHVIRHYEGNEKVELKGGKLFVDGNEISSYTFKQDYYFMMGDNRHNSADSRFWGFVPADHILGKALFVWMSINPEPTEEQGRFRWNRMFSGVK